MTDDASKTCALFQVREEAPIAVKAASDPVSTAADATLPTPTPFANLRAGAHRNQAKKVHAHPQTDTEFLEESSIGARSAHQHHLHHRHYDPERENESSSTLQMPDMNAFDGQSINLTQHPTPSSLPTSPTGRLSSPPAFAMLSHPTSAGGPAAVAHSLLGGGGIELPSGGGGSACGGLKYKGGRHPASCEWSISNHPPARLHTSAPISLQRQLNASHSHHGGTHGGKLGGHMGPCSLPTALIRPQQHYHQGGATPDSVVVSPLGANTVLLYSSVGSLTGAFGRTNTASRGSGRCAPFLMGAHHHQYGCSCDTPLFSQRTSPKDEGLTVATHEQEAVARGTDIFGAGAEEEAHSHSATWTPQKTEALEKGRITIIAPMASRDLHQHVGQGSRRGHGRGTSTVSTNSDGVQVMSPLYGDFQHEPSGLAHIMEQQGLSTADALALFTGVGVQFETGLSNAQRCRQERSIQWAQGAAEEVAEEVSCTIPVAPPPTPTCTAGVKARGSNAHTCISNPRAYGGTGHESTSSNPSRTSPRDLGGNVGLCDGAWLLTSPKLLGGLSESLGTWASLGQSGSHAAVAEGTQHHQHQGHHHGHRQNYHFVPALLSPHRPSLPMNSRRSLFSASSSPFNPSASEGGGMDVVITAGKGGYRSEVRRGGHLSPPAAVSTTAIGDGWPTMPPFVLSVGDAYAPLGDATDVRDYGERLEMLTSPIPAAYAHTFNSSSSVASALNALYLLAPKDAPLSPCPMAHPFLLTSPGGVLSSLPRAGEVGIESAGARTPMSTMTPLGDYIAAAGAGAGTLAPGVFGHLGAFLLSPTVMDDPVLHPSLQHQQPAGRRASSVANSAGNGECMASPKGTTLPPSFATESRLHPSKAKLPSNPANSLMSPSSGHVSGNGVSRSYATTTTTANEDSAREMSNLVASMMQVEGVHPALHSPRNVSHADGSMASPFRQQHTEPYQ